MTAFIAYTIIGCVFSLGLILDRMEGSFDPDSVTDWLSVTVVIAIVIFIWPTTIHRDNMLEPRHD